MDKAGWEETTRQGKRTLNAVKGTGFGAYINGKKKGFSL